MRKPIALGMAVGILASANSDETVRLWDMQGCELRTLKGHSSDVNIEYIKNSPKALDIWAVCIFVRWIVFLLVR